MTRNALQPQFVRVHQSIVLCPTPEPAAAPTTQRSSEMTISSQEIVRPTRGVFLLCTDQTSKQGQVILCFIDSRFWLLGSGPSQSRTCRRFSTRRYFLETRQNTFSGSQRFQ